MHNPERDAAQMAANRLKFMKTGYRLFVKNTIDGVSLEQVAKASGIGVATLYRYFGNKLDLVIAISVWKWEEFLSRYRAPAENEEGKRTGAGRFAYYLDSFLELYRSEKDLLRFNQFLNVYLQRTKADRKQTAPYDALIGRIGDRFRIIWEKGQQDGTLQAGIPWQEAFSVTLHLMLAAASRYAVGLVYRVEESADPEAELVLLRNMLFRQYIRTEPDGICETRYGEGVL